MNYLNFRFNTFVSHVAQLGDSVVIIEGKSDEPGTNYRGIFVWDDFSDSPRRVGNLTLQRWYSMSVKITTRWFPNCIGNGVTQCW